MITEKITSDGSLTKGQQKVIVRLLNDALNSDELNSIVDSLELDKTEAQRFIENGGSISESLRISMLSFFKKNQLIKQRFKKPIAEFMITVPSRYYHETWIDHFSLMKRGRLVEHFDEGITSANYRNASNKLIPGDSYLVRIVSISFGVTSIDCINYLVQENAILVGAQGLLLIYDLAKEKLPINKYVFSLDKEDNLWKDSDNDSRVPIIFARTDGSFGFSLGYYLKAFRQWTCDYYLLVVNKSND